MNFIISTLETQVTQISYSGSKKIHNSFNSGVFQIVASRHCEGNTRSKPETSMKMDCFASLAMTEQQKSDKLK